jgi:glycosyltransferase involved in cell wall biosynthesis
MAVGLATLLRSPALGRQFGLRHVNLNFEGRGRWGRVAGTLRALALGACELLLRRPDVVYLSLTRSRLGCLKDCVFLALAGLAGSPVVGTVRGGDLGVFYASLGPVARRLVRWAYGRLARAIALGPSLAGQYAGLVPAERVRVVWNACPDHEMAKPLERRPRGPGEPLRLVFLSNVLPSKGLFDALEGAALARARGVPLRFTFAGEFQERDGALAKRPESASENVGRAALAARYEAAIERLGLRDVASRLGTVAGRAKWDLLCESDVLVLPIWNPTEGQPLAILEAMRAGCAVVTTAVGGVRDLVEDGVTGRVVPPRSPRAVADAVEGLWRRPEDLARFSRANQALAARRHGTEAHVERTIGVLREALAGDTARGAAEGSGALGWATAEKAGRWS